MKEAFVCDAIRTPFGRYGRALAAIRADDLAAIPIRALMERNPKVDWAATDDVVYALCTMCIGVGQGIAIVLERC